MNIACSIELLANYKKEWGMLRYMNPGDAGFDLRAAIDESVVIPGTCRHIIPCGFKIAIPEGYQLEIRPRSGLAAKQGITVLNTPGTVDSGYRGEIKVILINTSTTEQVINPGDRIAQAVLMPAFQINFDYVVSMDETERGSNGFGSTGSN